MSPSAPLMISFCIPVMGRLEDLKTTLPHNLETVRQFADRVDLVIGCFDSDSDCSTWVHERFEREIDLGLLRFINYKPLPRWHFAWAKNAFAEDVSAYYYSSLDADNYLDGTELADVLELVGDPQRRYLVHHFSGQWGDGTSGRLTFPTSIYKQSPYLEELLPRQFDENAVILRILSEHSDVIFAHKPNANVLTDSKFIREYISRNNLMVHEETHKLGSTTDTWNAANPRGRNYVEESDRLFYFQQLNAWYSLARLSLNTDAREYFDRKLRISQEAYCQSGSIHEDVSALLEGPGLGRLKRESSLTLYTVVKDDLPFLYRWLEHYRRLGVERFVIVDDNSDIPLKEAITGDDIFIVSPRFGAFRTSKVFWLRVLMGLFQTEGTWVLTADADEFLDVPNLSDSGDVTGLRAVTARAEEAGRAEVPGLLIDMMPEHPDEQMDEDTFLDVMDHVYFRPPTDQLGYGNLGPVRWAFGEYWFLSLAVDVRFRLYGTVDCLRKMPLFKHEESTYLNQGFHTIYRKGRSPSAGELLDPKEGILPIRHYKMAKFLPGGKSFEPPTTRLAQYDERAQWNQSKIVEAEEDYVYRSWLSTPFKMEYDKVGGILYPAFPADRSTLSQALAASRSYGVGPSG